MSFGSRLRGHEELYLDQPEKSEILGLEPLGVTDGTCTALSGGGEGTWGCSWSSRTTWHWQCALLLPFPPDGELLIFELQAPGT